YKRTQEFLQERRLLNMQMEELNNQYIVLGGDEKLKELEEFQDITIVGNKKGIKRRKVDYFKNFREDIREEVSEMYHITKENKQEETYKKDKENKKTTLEIQENVNEIKEKVDKVNEELKRDE